MEGDPLTSLTRRHRTVLGLTARGLTQAQIAARLKLSRRQVVRDLERARETLDTPTTTAAVVRYLSLVRRPRRRSEAETLELRW